MDTLIDRLMAKANGYATRLNSVDDTLPTAVADASLFASANTLAGHAQGAVRDGAAEEFDQDHGGKQ